MRRVAVAVALVVLTGAVAVPAAGAKRVVPPQPSTCDVTGTGTLRRPLVATLPAGTRAKANVLTITANLVNCRSSMPGGGTSVTHGTLLAKIKVPTHHTRSFLDAATVSYTMKLTYSYAVPVKPHKVKLARTVNASPFRPLPNPGGPAAPVVLELTGPGTLGFNPPISAPWVLTLATNLVAPAVYQSGAPNVSSFSIGSFLGEDSTLVVPPAP